MSRSGDFRGDNRQTDRQTDYFTPVYVRGVIKFGWSKYLQGIVLCHFLYHLFLYKCMYTILPILQTSGITSEVE